jgi:hypothetical protein
MGGVIQGVFACVCTNDSNSRVKSISQKKNEEKKLDRDMKTHKKEHKTRRRSKKCEGRKEGEENKDKTWFCFDQNLGKCSSFYENG